ncbi:MAG: TRAP transporter substrate-binding protein [Candidatus Caldatribacteriota bacterium]|nr:TRAP transporter substrate-binding protein [Candidatus Caldatribacteriota bacterium]
MKKTISILLVISLMVGIFAISALAATRWVANSVWPPNNYHSIGLVEFAEKINEKTNGELNIVVETGGALGYKGPELLKAVRDGLVPLSDMLVSGVAGDEMLFQIVTLPFLALNSDEAKLLNTISRPFFDKAMAKWKQKILYIAPWPAAGLWTKEKVQSVEDMNGLKTRTYDKNGALVVEATGGTPYALPFSEVYSSLATGLIDSVITSSPTGVDGKFWEVLNYFQRLNITYATDMVTVNLRAFNKLDKETQQILIDTGKEMEEIMWERVKGIDKEKEALCNQNGIVSVPVTDELKVELSKITAGIREEWLAKAPADAIVIYKKFMEQVGR